MMYTTTPRTRGSPGKTDETLVHNGAGIGPG